MEDRRSEEPASGRGAVSRDLPDQQADGSGGPDRWDPDTGSRDAERGERDDGQKGGSDGGEDGAVGEDRDDGGADRGEDDDVPDTDEAGTGRRGSTRSQGAPAGQPVPDEPSD